MWKTPNIAMTAILAASVFACTSAGAAETYPTRTVRIVTAGAGGFHDIVARTLAQRLSELWGQAVVVENKPGAGLTIGTGMVAKAPPDGYTLLLGDSTSLAAAPTIYKDLRYDPAKDLAPITLVARAPAMLAAHRSVPADDLIGFIEYARQQAEPVPYASSGSGTFSHLTSILFGQTTGARVFTIQYKGGANASLALLRGEAKFSFLPIPTVLSNIDTGVLKVLAVTGRKRFDTAPTIPTVSESGFADLEAEQWLAMLAPAGTPKEIIQKLNRDIIGVLQTSSFEDILRLQGATSAGGTPAELASYMASEAFKVGKLFRASGLSSQ